MGLPYEKKKVNIISIVLDAPGNIISALSGKLGRLWGCELQSSLYKNRRKGVRRTRKRGIRNCDR